jgi:hypothetical protein
MKIWLSQEWRKGRGFRRFAKRKGQCLLTGNQRKCLF